MATKPKNKPAKPKEKFLHRIDINLSYLHYGENKEYTKDDVLRWLRNDLHEGELDSELNDDFEEIEKLKISLVMDKNQISNFAPDYPLYGPDREIEEILLHNAIDELNLHISVNEMIKRLQKVGYKVSK